MNKIDGIIFDLDGTLWNSKKNIANSWSHVLKKSNYTKKEIDEDEFTHYIGKTIDEIGKEVFYEIDEENRKKLLEECCEYTNKYLEKVGSPLYDNLEKMLIEANKKYDLFIVSNCNKGYIETFLNYYDFWKYFKDIECSGETGLSKGENIKLIMKRNSLKNAIYVGDTDGDSKAARIARIDFVFAKYGYGQTKDYDYVIDNINSLINILK